MKFKPPIAEVETLRRDSEERDDIAEKRSC